MYMKIKTMGDLVTTTPIGRGWYMKVRKKMF